MKTVFLSYRQTSDGERARVRDLGERLRDCCIRVVLFDDADATHISAKIKRYHRFHAVGDFAGIVKWLGGTIPVTVTSTATRPQDLHPSLPPAPRPLPRARKGTRANPRCSPP